MKAEDNLLRELIFAEIRENEFHRDLCLKNINGNLFIAKAFREGLAGVVFYYLKKYGLQDRVSYKDYQCLSSSYSANVKKNMLTLGHAKWVLSKFNQAGLPFIVLKGLSLLEHDYPSLGMRDMSDIDILIKKDDLLEVDHCLFLMGYLPRDSVASRAINNPPGYLASLDYRKDGQAFVNLHIHWHTVNTSTPATMFAGCVDIERIWEKAVPSKIADTDARILSPEHTVIYLCEHAMRVGHSFDRLILIYDIFQFLINRSAAFRSRGTLNPINRKALLSSPHRSEEHIDWNIVIKESKRFNLSRLVYCGLAIVIHYSSLTFLSETARRLKPPTMTLGEKLFLSLQLRNYRIRGSSYLVYLAMNKGLGEKYKFICSTFFPPSQILAQKQYINNADTAKQKYSFRVYEIFVHFVYFLRQILCLRNTPR